MCVNALQAGLSEEQVCEKQRSVMAGLPEFGVKDMASWFRFVVISRPVLLQGLQVKLYIIIIVFVVCMFGWGEGGAVR